MPYLLDLNKLQPGDIIFESGTAKFSQIIKTVTGSDYSHAMLYVGQTIIHALTDGVYSKNPQRLLVEDISGLKVFRLKGGLKGDQLTHVLMFARNLTGSLYSIGEAGISPILGKVSVDIGSTKQFCSRLVAQCYMRVGIKLVKNPDFCSPADIFKSDRLVEVKDCVVLASAEEVAFADSEDPNIENQRRTFDWLNKARTSFKLKGVDIQTLGDVDQHILKHPSLDNEICKFIKASKFLEHYDVDKQLNTYRYDENRFAYVMSQQSDPALSLANEFNREPNEISRHSQSLFAAGLHYAFSGLEYNSLMIELYKNLLGMSHARLTVMEKYAPTIHQNNIARSCNYLLNHLNKLMK